MKLDPIATRFITFYSFKGGVGRSMALYNCACVLAGSGRRVLVIDFDLEAPGLTFLLRRMAQTPSTPAPEPEKPGLIEIILDFVKDPKAWPLRRTGSPEAVNEYITDLSTSIPNTVKTGAFDGRLCMIAAGRMIPDFAANLERIHWDALPLADARDALFDHLRSRIADTRQFDYVLVDARTGLSEEGYISTRILADDIVAVTGLNDQNIRGTARFLLHVDAWNKENPNRQRRIILVESPVPEAVEESVKSRHEEVRAMFKEEIGRELDFTLALPYHPLLALREEVMVANWPDSGLAKAYFRLTGLLRSLASDDADTWARKAMEAVQQSSNLKSELRPRTDVAKAQAAIETLRSIDAEKFRDVARAVAGLAAALDPPDPKAIQLLRRLAEIEPDEPQYYENLANLLHRMSKDYALSEVRDALQRLVDLRRKRGDEFEPLIPLFRLADVDCCLGRYVEARRGIEEVLNTFRELADGRLISAAVHLLADLDSLQGRYAKARQGLEEALSTFRELKIEFWISLSLYSLADLDRMQGRYEEARRGFQETLLAFRSLDDQQRYTLSEFKFRAIGALASPHENTATVLESLREVEAICDPIAISRAHLLVAEVQRAAGDLPAALESITKALAICDEHGFRGVEAEARAWRAVILAEQGKHPDAVEDAHRAIDFFEKEDVQHRLRGQLNAIVGVPPRES